MCVPFRTELARPRGLAAFPLDSHRYNGWASNFQPELIVFLADRRPTSSEQTSACDRLVSCAVTKKSLLVAAALLAFAASAISFAGAQPAVAIRGFSARHALREAEFEQLFRSLPTAARAREDLKALTREPHVAGTPADYRTAQFVLQQFRKAGLSAEIEEYQVLLPMPKEVKVELVAPIRREASTNEALDSSEASGDDPGVIAAFNAFSPSGEITAPVVYANYGLPEDYAQLERMGVDVAGKTVIVRYGKCFRGVKAYVAELHHAGALLIYSDPEDDGYRQGEVWPLGPWRPQNAMQRGSILPLYDYAGDPLTPGVTATPGAKRLPLTEVHLPSVMTTPLSYADAEPILRNLSGPHAPRDWQGGLPFPYHVGPGASIVHIKLQFDYRQRAIWDVVAKIPGAISPGEWVIAGNHRDAWTYGAADPGSGTVALLAVARGLGELLKRGWRPQRTVVLASWDAEEFGLMGSTEWAEQHAQMLGQDAVAYLNVDVGVCGPHFGAAAVPSLSRLIRDLVGDVSDPATGRTVLDVWREAGRAAPPRVPHGVTGASDRDQEPVPEPPEARVRELGSGSDYTAFLEHLGVPSLDFGFSGPYGVYHSRFDDFDWMQKFGDPTFRYSVAEAQIYGTLAMRLADADVLPLDYEEYGTAIRHYLRDLEVETSKEHPGGSLDTRKALHATLEFTRVAGLLRERLQQAEEGGQLTPQASAEVDRLLLEVERNFLLDKGLPGRPWFRHAFYAPGVYTGYAAVILPGVREALDRNDWETARRQLGLVQVAIERGTRTLSRALEALSGPVEPAAAGQRLGLRSCVPAATCGD
jgi:N-acetylated-alpha-linked acidic dipeptidase